MIVHDRCPVGDLVGQPHTYAVGTGHVVPWDVQGDPRSGVEICGDCYAAETHETRRNAAGLDGFAPDLLRDAARVLGRWAAGIAEHPDCAPEHWETTREWPQDVRRRAARIAALGAALDAIADERGDL